MTAIIDPEEQAWHEERNAYIDHALSNQTPYEMASAMQAMTYTIGDLRRDYNDVHGHLTDLIKGMQEVRRCIKKGDVEYAALLIDRYIPH